MEDLSSRQRKTLEKAAHNLDPVVIIGQNGVTDGLIQMIISSLKAHELIKVKFNEFKEDREEYSREIAQVTDSILVRIIGNVAIFYKENSDPRKRKYSLKD